MKNLKSNGVVIMLGLGLLAIIGAFIWFKFQKEKIIDIVEEPEQPVKAATNLTVQKNIVTDPNKKADDEQPS